MVKIASIFTFLVLSLWQGSSGLLAISPDGIQEIHFQKMFDNSLGTLTVQKIRQTNQGLIWFQAEEGLGFFDGQQVTLVKRGQGPQMGMDEDGTGKIWYLSDDMEGGEIGLIGDYPDIKKTAANLPSSRIGKKAILRGDPDGLWISFGDSILYRRSLEVQKQIVLPFTAMKSGKVLSFLPADDGNILLGTPAGIFIYHPENKKFEHIKMPGQLPLPVTLIHRIKAGQYLVGTSEGVFSLARVNGKYHLGGINKTGNVTCALNNKREWLGTTGQGLFEMPSLGSSQIHNYRYEPCNQFSLPSDQVLDLYQSRDGLLWITTSEGVCTFDSEKFAFGWTFHPDCNPNTEIRNVVCLLEDGQKRLWVGRDEGMQCVECPKNLAGIFPLMDGEGEVLPVLAGAKGKDKLFWLGSGAKDGLIFSFDPEKHRYSAPVSLGEGKANYPRTMLFDKNLGELWVGTNGNGLIRFDPKSNRIIKRYFPDEGRRNTLLPGPVNLIFQDKKGRIWVGAGRGMLYQMDEGKTEFKRIIIGEEKGTPGKFLVASMAEVSFANGGQRFYLGTLKAGIIRLDFHAGGRIEDYKISKSSHGLASDDVFGLLLTSDEEIWASTSLGISRIREAATSKTEISNFDHDDGLQPGAFASDAYLIRQNGEYAFGGERGLNKFHPYTISIVPRRKVPVLIKSILVVGENNTMLKEYNFPGHTIDYVFPYNQNNLKIAFSPLEYRSPRKLINHYLMIGHDLELSRTMEQKFAYVAMGSGKFGLFIESWVDRSGKPKDLSINLDTPLISLVIKKPFWLRLDFIFLAGIFLAGLGLFIGIEARRGKQRRKERKLLQGLDRKETELLKKENELLAERTQKVETEQKNAELKRDIMEIRVKAITGRIDAHFTKNALNAIQGMVLTDESVKASDSLSELSNLIKLSMVLSNELLIPLASELKYLGIYLKMEIMRFGEKIKYRIEHDEVSQLKEWFVPPMVIQIYVENAIKHGLSPRKEGGTVVISFAEVDQQLRCIIKDDGLGRKIKPKSRGHGMDLASERLDLLARITGAEIYPDIIDLTDAEGNPSGTKVTLLFPKKYQNNET